MHGYYSVMEEYMIHFNLQFFADGGEGEGTQPVTNVQGYSFEQAEEIANARAERATKSALSSYFKQQGMTEDEVTKALADYKARKEAQTPDTTKISEENANLRQQLADVQNKASLTTKGVKAEFVDYVTYEVNKKVTDKVSFEKAAEEFLKEHPMYVGQTVTVSTGTQGGSGSASTARDMINAAIRGRR